MTYKTVLLHIDDSAGRAARIEAAASIAQACGGHLTGVALTGVSRLLYQNQPDLDADPNLALHLNFLRERATRSLDGFEAQVRAAGVASFEQRVVDDEAAGGISVLARYADLVVISQYNAKDKSPSVMRDFPAYVLLHSGRPVLIVPYAPPLPLLAQPAAAKTSLRDIAIPSRFHVVRSRPVVGPPPTKERRGRAGHPRALRSKAWPELVSSIFIVAPRPVGAQIGLMPEGTLRPDAACARGVLRHAAPQR